MTLFQAPAVMSAANGMNGALADPAVAPAVVGGWASNDAFASGFDDNKSPVSTIFFRNPVTRKASLVKCHFNLPRKADFSLN